MTRVIYIKPLSATDGLAVAFNEKFSVGVVFEVVKMLDPIKTNVYQYTLKASQEEELNISDREYKESFKELS